jgi:hypothetical protein
MCSTLCTKKDIPRPYPCIVLSLLVGLLLGCGADLETEGLAFAKPPGVGQLRGEALDCLSLDMEKGAC